MGSGRAITCAYPVELLLARIPDAHGPADRSWGLYAGLAHAAGIEPVVEHPQVTTGSLRGAAGGAIAITNHGPDAAEAAVRMPEGARHIRRIDGAAGPLDTSAPLLLDPYGAALLAWDAPGR
jgi:hypothetical protein